jgi:hypothetical protein
MDIGAVGKFFWVLNYFCQGDRVGPVLSASSLFLSMISLLIK